MRIKGKITQWDDAKGFGFIVPMLQGERVFLHIKALQNRTRRPVVGEVVTYSIGKDEQGRLQAKDVTFAGETQRIKAAKTASSVVWLWVACFACVLAVAWKTYQHFTKADAAPELNPPAAADLSTTSAPPSLPQFRCDGRTHCSEMQSREEAVFFINNCPNTQMDGDHDGNPCESQFPTW